ncbi:MAG TPA: DUF5060 domain-containing protein [Gemmataceae bacterium]|nr:DUF5060 domain-containing protein [Gemmataceae bacterium]
MTQPQGTPSELAGRKTRNLVWAVMLMLLAGSSGRLVCAANFTTGAADAVKFGTHEIVLRGNGAVANPFDTVATVTFTPPSGAAHAVSVHAFHDGGNTWRARLYVTEAGTWRWASSCTTDPGLKGKSGKFQALSSALPGMLRKHKANPRQWMTDDGQWFVNLSDTGYRLFHAKDAPLWKQFVQDSAAKGVTCIRAACLGGWGGTPRATVDDNNTWTWNDPWAGGAAPDYRRYDLAKLQNTDSRLIWIFNHHPDLYFQFVLFSFKGYGTEGTGKFWQSLPQSVRTNTMRYMIARWSAFPNLFWLIVNDMHCDANFPRNRAFVREVGPFFAAHDPWQHLISTGPNRHAGFPFTSAGDLKWCSYIYIEDANAVGADQLQKFRFDKVPLHVWMGEDYYEHDYGEYADPRFFFRWLFWSWLLSGGSANYAGRWGPIHPYSQTSRADLQWTGAGGMNYKGRQLKGLDSVAYIRPYFKDRRIDLAYFLSEDRLASDLDGREDRRRPKLMRRGRDEFLVYHPNAASDGKTAGVDKTRTARVRIDMKSAPGTFEVEWYRAYDGTAKRGGTVQGGSLRDFAAPWRGSDVVLRLLKKSSAN